MGKKLNLRTGIWLAVLFSISGLYFAFQNLKGVSWRIGWELIRWEYIAIGAIALVLVWFSKAYRMFTIAQGMGIKIPLIHFYKIYMATCFISHVTPFSSGGTPLQVYLITKKGVSVGKASAITVVDLGLNTIMFVMLGLFAVVLNVGMLDMGMLAVNWSKWWLWIVFGGFAAFLLYKWLRGDWFLKIPGMAKIQSSIKKGDWLNKFRHEFSRFKEGWNLLFRENPWSILWAMAATVIYWLFYLMLAPIVIRALGKEASFLGIMGWQLFFNFAQLLIPTPGGSGGSELLLSLFFKNITGVSLVGVFVLFWKIYTFFSTLVIGAWFFFQLTRKEFTGQDLPDMAD
jgi:uncharacterized protein (TIRG00374 family)